MDIKRISFERTGGFAGIRLATDFKLSDLPDEQARQLADLLGNMGFNELPQHFGGTNIVADGFTYEVTVETTEWTHTITAGEMSLPEKLDSLLELLNKIARERARKK